MKEMTMIPKQDLLKINRKEYETTLKVMRAFPESQLDFSPHERSSDAKKIMSTFVFEMYLLELHVFGKVFDNKKFKEYNPGSLQTLISDFENESSRILANIDRMSEEDLVKTVEFAGSKSQADEFILKMLFDQIHHRGQLTVYIRLAGGKVPSVYGPSADDPTTNL
jgi:uncharacterized damage-inducible protein DinB